MGATQELCIDAAKRALERAYAEGVHQRFAVIESDDDGAEGVYRAPGGDIYFVQLSGCTCKGSAISRCICKHQACLADLTGKLDLLIPGVYDRAAADAIAA